MTQFTDPNAPNRLLRLEPLDGTNRISEDRFALTTAELPPNNPLGGTDAAPSQGQAVSFTSAAAGGNLSSAVQWHLGDIPLIVLDDRIDGSFLSTYNPFTGTQTSIISNMTSSPSSSGAGGAAAADKGRLNIVHLPALRMVA